MTDEDWIVLFEYLLERMAKEGAGGLADEIRAQVDTLVLVDADEVEAPTDSKKARRTSLSRSAVRVRRPQERFRMAMEIVTARLVELPAIESRVAPWLGIDLSEILFAPDSAVEASESDVSEFAIPSFSLGQNVQAHVLALLDLTVDSDGEAPRAPDTK